MGTEKAMKRMVFSWRLLMADMVLGFLWVVSGVYVKVIARELKSLGNEEVMKMTLYVITMFIFTWLGKVTNGASYNPVSALTSALTDDRHHHLYVPSLVARIAAEALGSTIGVGFLKNVMQMDGVNGSVLRVSWKKGMAVEGTLTFIFVLVKLILSVTGPTDFVTATWIISLTRLSLSIIGANYTGSAMNPASAFGWAYFRGEHNTKEHIYVYWLAPLEACILAIWIFQSTVSVPKKKKSKKESERVKND